MEENNIDLFLGKISAKAALVYDLVNLVIDKLKKKMSGINFLKKSYTLAYYRWFADEGRLKVKPVVL